MDQREQQSQAIEQGIILERVNNLIKTNAEAHRLILEQTTITNGRVSGLMSWKDKATGGFIVVNILVVPIVLWLFIEKLKTVL